MSSQATVCNRCRKATPRFVLAERALCLRCTLLQRSLLRRSFLTALVVGSILTAINQGNVLLAGDFPSVLYWKIPLTYSVPFCVATWGALINTRLPRASTRETIEP